MATGKEIKEIYDAMKSICIETSRVLKAVNDLFENQGFSSAYGYSVMWGRSGHYLSPQGWLPYFQQMVFKNNKGDPGRVVGLNIMFDDENLQNKIPFISCGLICAKPGNIAYTNDAFYYAGWYYDETELLDEQTPIFYTDLLKVQEYHDKYYTKIINYFLPVEVISDQEKVKELIIDPLLCLYEENIAGTIQQIKGTAISIDFIKGDEE